MSRDSETVSKNMRSIHSKDTSIELQLRKALWHKGYRYRKNYKALPGSPDIVLTKYKIAIFCDSEFFHGKDWEILKLRLEKGKNPDYWIKKIERNRSRDFETDKKLLFLGYTVIHFQGQDIKKHTDECIQAIEEAIWDSTFSDSSFDSSDEQYKIYGCIFFDTAIMVLNIYYLFQYNFFCTNFDIIHQSNPPHLILPL